MPTTEDFFPRRENADGEEELLFPDHYRLQSTCQDWEHQAVVHVNGVDFAGSHVNRDYVDVASDDAWRLMCTRFEFYTTRDLSELGGPIPGLGFLAWVAGLPSQNAAAYVIQRAHLGDQTLHGFRRTSGELERISEIWAYIEDEHGTVSSVCHCSECYLGAPGTYGRYDTDWYWPNGQPCNCEAPHCPECHPDGPPDWCDCSDCVSYRYGDGVDDQGDYLDEEYTPVQLPPEVPGRPRFGIEIEFNNGSRYDIISAMMRAGLACQDEAYGHATQRYWKMTTDATVTGGELVSPVLDGGDAAIESVRTALNLVKLNGGRTGRNVGLHVHIDVTQFRSSQLKVLANNLRHAEKLFAGFVPNHRYEWDDDGDQENEYGATLISPDGWDRIEEWLPEVDPTAFQRSAEMRTSGCPVERFSSFNFNSLLTYGTVECRLLGHTLNTIKVRAFIRTLQTMFDASRRRRVLHEGDDVLDWLIASGLEAEHADRFRAVVSSRNNDSWLLAQAS